MITQTFDLVLKRTVSSRRLSCVPSTYVLLGRATSYHCLCYDNSLLFSKLLLLKHLTWSSKKPVSSRRLSCVPSTCAFPARANFITTSLMNTAYLDLSYDYSSIWLGSQRNRLVDTIFFVPLACVFPDRVTFYYCLGDKYSLLWLKLWLLKHLTWYSKEPSHRDDSLGYPHHVFCLVEQLFTFTLATITADLCLN